MTQKVIKVGSSAAVVIPKKTLESLGMKIGDSVSVDVERKKKTIKISPSVVVDNELVDWTDGFITKYKKALEALADQ